MKFPRLLFILSVAIMAHSSCKNEAAPVVDVSTSVTINHSGITEDTKMTISTPFTSQELLLTGTSTNLDLDIDGLTTVSYRLGDASGKFIANNEGKYALTVDSAKQIEFLNPTATQSLYTEVRGMVNEEIGEYSELSKREETDFLAKITGLKDKIQTKISAAEGDQASLEFVQQEMKYALANYLGKYKVYHAHFAEKEDFDTSDEFKAYQKTYKHDALIKGSANYNSFLSAHYENMVEDDDENYNKTMVTGARAETNKALATYAEALVFKNMLKYDDKGDFGDDITNILAKIDYAPLKNGLKKNLKKWNVIEAGKEAPAFAYNDINGKEVQLADFKGKFVYIDVWATWCGPCKAEAPYFEELEKKYRDNDEIVFMGVSIDKDKEAWEKMVTKKDMKGVQLIADKAWQSSIANDYLIKGIPRFLLIGKDGKIIDATAPRPSEEVLSTLLGELVGV